MELVRGVEVRSRELLVPGFSLHRELEQLVAAGLTPLDALRAATINPARFLEATDSLGTIEPGKLADLVLLDADPLVDIRPTQRIRAVVTNGRYLDLAALDALLLRAAVRGPKERLLPSRTQMRHEILLQRSPPRTPQSSDVARGPRDPLSREVRAADPCP